MSSIDIEKLISELTTEEKALLVAGKDFWHTNEVDRLGIPSIRLSDGPNGIRGTKFFNGWRSGCFPCGTALASTFDLELLQEAGELMAKEAKAKAAHVILGPTLNIQRGPLGGRGFESFSEDPMLSGLCTAAIVKGIESKGISATVKHFVGNDLEDERNSINSLISQRALREVYLYPFQIAVKDAKPSAFMSSYNKVNGEHVSQSAYLLKDILRKEWGFEGSVMSDWFGVYSLNQALTNGLDLEMPGPPKIRKQEAVAHAVLSKEVHIDDLDDRVRGVLRLVKRAVEESGIPKDAPETSSNDTPETSAFLRDLSAQSIVLLKNENNILPLKKDEKIAVFGPNAKFAAFCGGGSASMLAYYTVSPYEGIAKKLGQDPAYTVGAEAYKYLPGLGPQLRRPDGSKGYVAKFFLQPPESKERTLVDELHLDTSVSFLADYYNDKIVDDIYYIDIEGDFTPEQDGTYIFGSSVFGTSRIYINDKIVVSNFDDQVAGDSFFGAGSIEEKGEIEMKAGETYHLKMIVGSGKTSEKFGKSLFFSGTGFQFGCALKTTPEIEISKAIDIAKTVDKIVVCIGTNGEFESEGYDRPDMKLPGAQAKLVEELAKVNKNIVVVNQSGTPVELPFIDEVPALVQAWFGGNETGNAIADVLFGDVNPSGKLSLSFPIRNQDNPAYFNFKSNNGQVIYGEDVYVGYKFYEMIDRPVLYPFGFGLSYTKFDFSEPSVELEGSEIVATVKVTNSGKIEGKESVQVYVLPNFTPKITRPLKELKGVTKVSLAPGETKELKVKIPIKYATSYYDEYKDAWCSEAGAYKVLIGNSSSNILVEGEVEVTETVHWKGL